MSFRDNLQHLRATRNMTQEQLAMLLGVSRQSVSKWEAERAYPEMDKLLKLSDLFDCTLDDLVIGDMTARSLDTASSIPSNKAPHDVTGYEQMMRSFALKLSLGASIPLLSTAIGFLCGLIPGIDSQSVVSVSVFIGLALGSILILPALFSRRGFRKAHPFIEDFYTVEQKDQARSALLKSVLSGIVFILAGLVAVLLMQDKAWLSISVFLALFAIGVFFFFYGYQLNSRCNIEAYNQKALLDMSDTQIDALEDEDMQAGARVARKNRSIYKIIMVVATIAALLLLFMPMREAHRLFWLPWVLGILVSFLINTIRSFRSRE